VLSTQPWTLSSLDSTQSYIRKKITASCSPLHQGACVHVLLGQQLLEAHISLSVQEGCSVTRGNRQSATRVRTGSLMNVTLFHSSPQDALQRSTFQPSAHVRMPVSMPAMVAAKHVKTNSGQTPGLMLLPDRTSKLGQQLGTTCVTENAIER